jgi:ATP-binding cassette subfamily B protein
MKIIRRFISFYRPHRKLFTLDMATAFVRASLTVMIPLLVRQVLKEYLPNGNLPMLWLTIGVAALIVAGMSITNYINMKWGHILGTRIETDMRSDLFRHLQKLSFRYFDNTKTGHIMSRISNDLFTISEVAHHAPEDLFISTVMILGAFIVMTCVNPYLGLLALLPLPVMVGWGGYYRRRMKQGFRTVRRRIADINSNVENSIQGIREVKSYTNEQYEIGKFAEVNIKFRSAKEFMYGVMASFHTGMMFLAEMYYLVIIAGGSLLIYHGKITLPDLVASLMYVRFILDPIRRLVNFIEQFQQGAASFERFIEVMDVAPDITDREDAESLPRIEGDLEMHNVFFTYDGSDDWVLQDISITEPRGRTVALVGESGAGKTTLATLIPRFYEVQKGEILIDGHNVMDLRQRCLRENIGLVQQNVFLFDTTIKENILFGKPDATDDELREAAHNANILSFIETLPDGFDSLTGERGVKLSGGQRQRISIARVFLKNPPILIFDEATSSLDSESETLIRQSMEMLCRNRTTVIIAHRLSTVKHADHTYVLRKGKILEEGTHNDLLALRGYYYKLYSSSVDEIG